MKLKKLLDNVLTCFKKDKVLWVIVLLLFLERLIFLLYGGVHYGLNSDDGSYINAGIHFANTGIISIHTEYPSAQIMPGMPVLIGLLSFVFGKGRILWLVLKLIWITFGCMTAFFTGKIVSMFAPRFCGWVAACLFFAANFVWMDNLILTETPYIFLFVLSIWSVLKMRDEKKYFILFLAAFFCAFMLRVNIIMLPVFLGIYLLATKYDKRLLLKQAIILISVLMLFIIPWSIRNHMQFQRFIPFTYGAGNAMMLGTYQGTGYPSDEDLDYETNVFDVRRERFSSYYDDDGEPIEPKYKSMLNLERDGIKANYRMSYWWENSPKTMLYSYLFLKPKYMLTSVFYWDSVFGVTLAQLTSFRTIELWLSAFAVFSAFYLKKRRDIILLFASYYLFSLMTYAFSFSFDRYAELIIVSRYIILGIGIPLILEVLTKVYNTAMEYYRHIGDGV